MANPHTHWLSNKLRHIGSNVAGRMSGWGKIGLGIGAIGGLAVGLLTAAPLLATVATATIAWGVTGAILGGAWGAIKGALTRPEPDVDQIMRDAERCGPEGPAHSVSPSVAQGLMQGVAPGMASPAPPAPKAAPKMTPPQASMDEIRQLTDALGQMEGVKAGMGAGKAAPPQQGNWQERVAAQATPPSGQQR